MNLFGFFGFPGAVLGIHRRLTLKLLSAIRQYQDYLSDLSAESRRRLSEFTGEVMRIVGA